jgi:hypothetical protein
MVMSGISVSMETDPKQTCPQEEIQRISQPVADNKICIASAKSKESHLLRISIKVTLVKSQDIADVLFSYHQRLVSLL